jgi:hypothetical protein
MNRYNGGPNSIAAKINTINISFQPIAMTGSQAKVVVRIVNNPITNLLLMDYFNIGILIP